MQDKTIAACMHMHRTDRFLFENVANSVDTLTQKVVSSYLSHLLSHVNGLPCTLEIFARAIVLRFINNF